MRRSRSLRLLLASALVAGGVVATALPASAFNDQVSVLDFRYSSNDLTVTEGDTVVWRWDGRDTHTVTAVDESFNSGTKYPGDDFAVTFDSPGEYAYFCLIHGPQMSGVVEVMPEDGTAITPASDDNVATSIAWSQAAVDDGGAPAVLLGRDDAFPDSLASGGAQGAVGAPLLLNPSDQLDDRVKDELERLGAGDVTVLGGEVAISADVVAELEAEGYVVTRIGGVDRIATAFFVAQRYFPTSDEAIIARAFGPGTAGFADSLGAGALAAKLGIPVLVNPTDRLSPTVKRYLEEAGVSTVHIAGGTAAISQDVQDALTDAGYTVNRHGGVNRFETNELIAAAGAGGFFDPEDVVAVIDGSVGNADAWASGFAAALAVSSNGMLVVADGETFHDGYLETLVEFDPAVICGPDAHATACGDAVNAASTGSFIADGRILAVANTPSDASVEDERAWLDLRPADAPGTACWVTANGSLSRPIVASHIHKVSDKSAVFGTGAIPPGASPTVGCGEEINDGDLAAILASPGDYYWNLHFDGTTETVSGDVTVNDEMGFTFGSGDQETGGGHPGGVTFSPHWFDANADDVFCIAIQSFIFGATGPVEVTGAHIHDGAAGEDGGIVIALDPPPAGNLVGGGCVATGDTALVDDIRANPNDYYLNLHTAEHPAGAVRGQLIDIMPTHSAPVVVS